MLVERQLGSRPVGDRPSSIRAEDVVTIALDLIDDRPSGGRQRNEMRLVGLSALSREVDGTVFDLVPAKLGDLLLTSAGEKQDAEGVSIIWLQLLRRAPQLDDLAFVENALAPRFTSRLLCMLKRVDLDDAATDAPHEHAMQMREDATSQDDPAAVGDVVDHGETCASINVSNETTLPAWHDVDADSALDALDRSIPSLISLEPLLEDRLEAHRRQ